jgi:hypothetical protein
LDDPDDRRALLDIMAKIVDMEIETEKDLNAIPKHKQIDNILKKHLKSDRIDP